jgi:hypothetical protein
MQTGLRQSRQQLLPLALLPAARLGWQQAGPAARGSQTRAFQQAEQHQQLGQAVGPQAAAVLLPALLVLCLRTVLLCQGYHWAAGPPAVMTQEMRLPTMGSTTA